MKKLLAILMAFLMSVTLLAGCNKGATTGTSEENAPADPKEADPKEIEIPDSDVFLDSNEEISYLLIYNPGIYDETIENNAKKTTGDLAAYVTPAMQKAGGLDEMPEFLPNTFDTQGLRNFLAENDMELDRAPRTYAPYHVGDTHYFYSSYDDQELTRGLVEFECQYAGEYCNVWVYDDWCTSSSAEEFGELFDEEVYEQTVELFGEPRFADNGHKVNILLTLMPDKILGYVHNYDIFASGEYNQATVDYYGLNTDHAIINVNAYAVNTPSYKQKVFTTMAHEFQHYICNTDIFYSANETCANTWLNEAMSGFVEDYLVEGAQYEAGRYDALDESVRIRHGQSLFNFDIDAEEDKYDIGVYGSVYIFSEYLANLADDETVFHDLHDYWRNSYSSTVCDAEALANVIPQSEKDRINALIEYPDAVSFKSDDEEFMSKLALDFYISLLRYDSEDPDAYKYTDTQNLLYDEINPADIEGGGRIIVELKDGKFEIPENADTGLVYVGLNSDFEVVTQIEYK